MIVTGEQARALRLRRHHLDRPLPSGALVEAAAGCGVQNSPQGPGRPPCGTGWRMSPSLSWNRR